MEKCASCGRGGEEVKLFDGLYVNDIVKVCERCSLISNIPLIKRPTVTQLKDSEKPFSVRSRLTRMAHLPVEQRKEKSPYEQLKDLEEKPELEQPEPEEMVFKLVDNFHWIIQTERRRRALSANQLAETISESVSAINMLEKGIVPSKSIDLIRALEQFFKVRLIKRDLIEKIEEEKRMNRGIAEKSPAFIEERKLPPKNIPVSLGRKESDGFKMRDLQALNDRIEKDFSYPTKSKEQVGKEQMAGFGKEDTEYLKKSVLKHTASSSYSSSQKSNVPTLYDLMKHKEERDKTSVTGSDIQIVEDKK